MRSHRPAAPGRVETPPSGSGRWQALLCDPQPAYIAGQPFELLAFLRTRHDPGLRRAKIAGSHFEQPRAVPKGRMPGAAPPPYLPWRRTNLRDRVGGSALKKLKHEAELVKAALLAGMKYGEERGAVEFEPTDSANERIQYIYRLLVHDQKIQPLPENQVSQQSMRHKLALWSAKQLPKDHPLLK